MRTGNAAYDRGKDIILSMTLVLKFVGIPIPCATAMCLAISLCYATTLMAITGECALFCNGTRPCAAVEYGQTYYDHDLKICKRLIAHHQ